MKYNGGNIQKLDKMLDKRFTAINIARVLKTFTVLMGLLICQGSSAKKMPQPTSLPIFGSKARIVSLAPAATEMLFYIGAGEQVVGRTNACDFPPEVTTITDVGSVFPPNLEAILRLKPDLVLMASGSNGLRKDLKKWGIFIHTFQPKRLKDIALQMRVLGDLTGRSQFTDSLALQFESALNRLRVKPSASSPRIYWEIWSQPMMTAGGTSFVHDLIEWAGGLNVFGHLKTAWPKVTSEAVVRAAPDFIFTVEKVQTSVHKKPWLKVLNLAPDKIVHIKAPDLVHRPSPRVLHGLQWLITTLEHTK